MKLNEWKKSFETGNAGIDAQHRELAESLNRIATLVDEGNGKVAFAVCNKFRELIGTHFRDETDILREAGFSRLKSHLKAHEELLEEYEKIYSRCGETCKDDTPSCPFMEELSFMTVDHLVRHDLDYKSFLQTRNLADGGS